MSDSSNPVPDIPENLFILLQMNASDFHLQEFFFPELVHEQPDFFPALLAESKQRVVTLDRQLAEEVRRQLPPRRSKVCRRIGHVNEKLGILYEEVGENIEFQKQSRPLPILCKSDFHRLIDTQDEPFIWTPGLVSSNMTKKEFARSIKATIKKKQ